MVWLKLLVVHKTVIIGSFALLGLTDTYSPAELARHVSGDTTSKNHCDVALKRGDPYLVVPAGQSSEDGVLPEAETRLYYG